MQPLPQIVISGRSRGSRVVLTPTMPPWRPDLLEIQVDIETDQFEGRRTLFVLTRLFEGFVADVTRFDEQRQGRVDLPDEDYDVSLGFVASDRAEHLDVEIDLRHASSDSGRTFRGAPMRDVLTVGFELDWSNLSRIASEFRAIWEIVDGTPWERPAW